MRRKLNKMAMDNLGEERVPKASTLGRHTDSSNKESPSGHATH